jgi:20S proteasome alpha/beta subunit
MSSYQSKEIFCMPLVIRKRKKSSSMRQRSKQRNLPSNCRGGQHREYFAMLIKTTQTFCFCNSQDTGTNFKTGKTMFSSLQQTSEKSFTNHAFLFTGTFRRCKQTKEMKYISFVNKRLPLLQPTGRGRRNGHVLFQIILITFALIVNVVVVVGQQQQSPLTMNGGSVLAMAGKNCVVLAVDKRFGSGRSLINVRRRPVIQLPPTAMVAFTGMEGDVQSLHIELNAQIMDKYYRGLGFGERIFSSDDENDSKNHHWSLSSDTTTTTTATITTSVTAVSMLTSHILYRRKRAPYYVEPIVVGLKLDGWEDDDVSDDYESETSSSCTKRERILDCHEVERNERLLDSTIQHRPSTTTRRVRYRPYLCCMDMIGAQSESEAFVCAGTASKSLYGTAEALWEPDLLPDELVTICTNAFMSALERDCLSGYGATVYLLTPNGITEYDISGRSD